MFLWRKYQYFSVDKSAEAGALIYRVNNILTGSLFILGSVPFLRKRIAKLNKINTKAV